jgi:hypothetical protein
MRDCALIGLASSAEDGNVHNDDGQGRKRHDNGKKRAWALEEFAQGMKIHIHLDSFPRGVLQAEPLQFAQSGDSG